MTKRSKPKPITPQRAEDGLSLATILAVGTVSSLWITAMMAIVLPTYQKTASLKASTTARAAAEAALDYTLMQMNNAISSGGSSSYDCGSSIGSSKVSAISPATLGLPNSNLQIQVMVQNTGLAAPQAGALTQPMIYDPQLAQLIAAGTLPNPYRQLTASATIGSVTKLLRVTLVPQAVTPAGAQPNLQAFPTMPFAAYGVNQTAFVGSVGLNSYLGHANGTYPDPPGLPRMNDPRVRADFGSGTTVNQVGYSSGTYSGMALGGSQLEFCDPISSGSQASSAIAELYNGSSANKAPWVNIYDNIYSNYTHTGTPTTPTRGMVYADQSTAGIPSTGYLPRGWDGSTGTGSTGNQQAFNNVFGLSNIMGSYPFGYSGSPDANFNAKTLYPTIGDNFPMGGAISTGQQYAKPQVPPVPSSPTSSVHLGAINLSGNATLVISKSAPAVTGQLAPMSSGTLMIPPGNYSITGLNMSGTSKILIDPSINTPTNLFLEGNVSTLASAPAVNVANTCDINMAGVMQTPGTSPNSIGSTGFNLSGTTGQLGGGTAVGTYTAINPVSSINEIAGSAGNLNLYYNGPGAGASGGGSASTPPSTTFLFNGRERMTVYAPNANIMIGTGTGYTRPTEFFGATVGNWVTVTGPQQASPVAFTAFHYDVKLRPNQGAFANPNSSTAVWGPPATTGGWGIAGGYKAVTWQEAKSPSPDTSTWNNSNVWQ